MAKGLRVMIWCFVLMVVILAKSGAAETYNVGDKDGWKIPTSNTYYTESWAEGKTFRVGDQLSFSWTATHDVANATVDQYENCDKQATLINGTSPLVVRLNTTGEHYFICTIGTHCQAGQKLKVNVLAANSSTTPSLSPSFVPCTTFSAAMSILIFSFLT